MRRRLVGVESLIVLAGMLALGGCAAGTETTGTETTDERNPAPAASAVPLKVSINALMVGMVDHSAHTIWDAARPDMAPKTDKAWAEIQHHAIQLAASGSAIAMPGTGKVDAEWAEKPEWRRYAREMADLGVAALTAAQAKDVKAISDVGDKLVETCEGCHKLYKGDLPTEGIVHPHY